MKNNVKFDGDDDILPFLLLLLLLKLKLKLLPGNNNKCLLLPLQVPCKLEEEEEYAKEETIVTF